MQVLTAAVLAQFQLKPGHMEKDDLVTLAFTLIVAGNGAMIAMIGLVSLHSLAFCTLANSVQSRCS